MDIRLLVRAAGELNQRLVLLTPRARLEYIRFATEASRFFRGRREVGFRGDDWRL